MHRFQVLWYASIKSLLHKNPIFTKHLEIIIDKFWKLIQPRLQLRLRGYFQRVILLTFELVGNGRFLVLGLLGTLHAFVLDYLLEVLVLRGLLLLQGSAARVCCIRRRLFLCGVRLGIGFYILIHIQICI